MLAIEFTTSPGSRKKTEVLRCPTCGCPFYADQNPPDYAEEAMLGRGRVPFYLQQGAGLSLITRPLAQCSAPAGSLYAEVGCGFGFGLDYARHAKNWIGLGIDPGGIATLGQNMLGVSIECRYLGDAEPTFSGTRDIILASETIEHVPSPARFVRVLRDMLRPGGILILTTPDGDDLRPETAPGVLIGLLSPGLHLIFQNRESLHRLLAETGFDHIIIHKDGHSLVAFASDRLVKLERDDAVSKAEYRAYLERRSADFSFTEDLFLAFAGRAFQESVNDGALDQAHRILVPLEQACVARFGHRLDALGQQLAACQGLSLQDLADRIPLSLGGLLYSDAILRLASGAARSALLSRFLWAAEAADLLQAALADLAMADAMTEEIAWAAKAEAVLCLAAVGADDTVARLCTLPPAPNPRDGNLRRAGIIERALIELVNAGHYTVASDLDRTFGLRSTPWADSGSAAPLSGSQRDALFCLAVLDSQSDEISVIERSRAGFERVRQKLEASDEGDRPIGLLEAAVRGEKAAQERIGHRNVASGAVLLSSGRAGG